VTATVGPRGNRLVAAPTTAQSPLDIPTTKCHRSGLDLCGSVRRKAIYRLCGHDASGRVCAVAGGRSLLALQVVRCQLKLQAIGVAEVDRVCRAVVLELECDAAAAEILSGDLEVLAVDPESDVAEP
jgi:hypothetical protein